MSNPESFIDEVTEEVRRDRLFRLMRRYGWIAVVLVLLIVGGAAWNEWRKAETTAASRAFGDALTAALEAPDAAARRAAVAAVPAEGSRAALRDLMLASDPAGDRATALAALERVAADATLAPSYRDLAVLRRVILAGTELPLAERRAALDGIAAPGRPYRTLALEQVAYLDIEAGEPAKAIETLRSLAQDQEATEGLRRRAEQMITALGGGTQAG
ncbi:tetratricopeptide repeat protein [Cereibacter sphaeroides]|uniref:tetratricopeptide repeat protein n=1 Tax=Cereibacter sphaeroides TaxID=1063 RepID=UPI001F25BA93|nr:tetratricopeptide repeat protein [Cereibacter sphaeroides]MCE6953202.1 tetratricopeptide repeat protein [Cereibacter sphaeroides]